MTNDQITNNVRRGSTRQNSSFASHATGTTTTYTNATKIRVYLSGPNLSNVQNETIELTENDTTIFFYLQNLLRIAKCGAQKGEKSRRIWEPTYTLIYENPEMSQSIKLSEIQKDEEENILEISNKSVVKQVKAFILYK